MGLNLIPSVVTCLQNRPEERFTARQVAQLIFEEFREACEGKRAQSRQDLSEDDALLQQLAAEVSSNRLEILRRNPQIKTTEGRPRHYFYTSVSDEAEVARLEGGERPPGTAPSTRSEQDLYPLLCKFIYSEWRIYPKCIDERRSSNRRGPNGNKWLFPDAVGMEDLSADWEGEVRDCVSQYGDKRARLWSFEVKILLNRSNVREAWFQAVSNSSWANFGYLVAQDVEGDDTMKELRMLSAAHGIGLIRLNADNPSESEIIIPARERFDIDWDACNRLAKENVDFLFFIKLVRQFHQTGDPRRKDWDIPKATE
ncbi:COG2958 family protein [Geomonas azotofigens]|uniref:COG2958 family protein n=1 Tax=Geomonas azotofigens TaxID=2843196 RepID=UPI001C125BFF|nr:hypothetical protein [Geomonas azotofigens]MBU5614469.1 hypothetical protein [Geomonas azotofigens]